jgi:hypothetical protein
MINQGIKKDDFLTNSDSLQSPHQNPSVQKPEQPA